MKKILQSTIVLLCFTLVKAQTVTPNVVSSDGGFSSSPQGSIEWTIGEPVSETGSTSNNVITTGFHQPELELATLIREQAHDQQLLIYPNPVRDFLKIDFSGINSGKYQLVMVDALGKLIYETEITISEDLSHFQLKVDEFAVGNYFLSLKGKDFNKTVKINKIN